jgi:hypothetical protein
MFGRRTGTRTGSGCTRVQDWNELPVKWPAGKSLSALRGMFVRLKLDLSNGSLYGFRFAT